MKMQNGDAEQVEQNSSEFVEEFVAVRKEAKLDSEDNAIKEWAVGREREQIEGLSSLPSLVSIYEDKLKKIKETVNTTAVRDSLKSLIEKIDGEIKKVPGGVASKELENEACYVMSLASSEDIGRNTDLNIKVSYEKLKELVGLPEVMEMLGMTKKDAGLLDELKNDIIFSDGSMLNRYVVAAKNKKEKLDAAPKKIQKIGVMGRLANLFRMNK